MDCLAGVIHIPIGAPSKTRYAGMQEASGQIIACFDDDDLDIVVLLIQGATDGLADELLVAIAVNDDRYAHGWGILGGGDGLTFAYPLVVFHRKLCKFLARPATRSADAGTICPRTYGPQEQAMSEQSTPRGMTMRYPATRWQDALPTGSGIVGAMVYGNIEAETILLNHDGLFYPKDSPPLIDVSDQLPKVRRLIEQGRCREAAQVMPTAYAQRSGTETGSTSAGRSPYQPLGAVRIATRAASPFSNYRRGVDFSTGRTWVQWTEGQCTFTRELFVSRTTDIVYLRISANQPGNVNCRLMLGKATNEQSEQELTHTGHKPGEALMNETVRVCSDTRTLRFTAEYPTGYTFGAIGHLQTTGGHLSATEDALCVDAADELVLRVRLFVDESAEDTLDRLLSQMNDQAMSYVDALAEHARAHGEIFDRVQVNLNDAQGTANELMLMEAYDGQVPSALIQRMFEFGRYLLICSSRPGGWPANLQGIWNGDYAPAWNSDVHTDENIQMNYWQALPGAMPEAALPLFDYFEKHIDDFRANARNVLGCRGILVPIAMTTHGKEIPCTWSNWTAAAGWIGQHFYDYYLFTGDREFLKHRAVPWLKETAVFYEDFLTTGEDGRLVFNPSLSPENRPTGGDSLMTINATMDVAICREVLDNLCQACELLGIEPDGVARWRDMLARLPEYEISEDGAIREWLHPHFADNYHHRHQSHLYPVFPGLQVTAESDPELFEACRVAVDKRLVIGLNSQTGWSMAHMANIYARLGEGDRALECLEILSRSSTGPNLLTYHNDWRGMGLSCYWGVRHPPFQIDANFGIASAVLEMLTFSKPGTVKLLPALPGKWNRGSVKGIACRGCVRVDITWNREARSLTAQLLSTRDQHVDLYLPSFVEAANVEPASALIEAKLTGDGCPVHLKPDTPVQIIAT